MEAGDKAIICYSNTVSAQVQVRGDTRSLPPKVNFIPIISGVVVALVILILILIIIIVIVIVVRNRRRATLKLEQTRYKIIVIILL